ncbi:MAG: choice-of-anchor L domain-containing protein [Bacteroidota bacterium]
MIRIRIFFILLLLPFCAAAQLQVQLDETPESIVQNTLLGDGVELLDVTFNGQSADLSNIQIGTFTNGLPAIGISDGIILSTGDATIANGPNELPTAFSSLDENELTEDADLSVLMGQSIELNDAAVLEFDFVASGDTLKFSYVFASEEYNEHTCSPYNDAFGFFISGPGIDGNGTFTNNAINVATIPGSDVPVAINSVNKGEAGIFGSNSICNATDINWQANSQYFVNNESNIDLNTTEFDGFTRVFHVEVPVICGETYKIKMAIADAVDGKNDSAVFIKSKSFSSETPLEIDYEIINAIQGIASEGCSLFDFRLTRGDSSDVKVVYLESEFAENNPDVFPNFPDSLVFFPAQGYLDWELPINYNNQFESQRTFDLTFLQPNVCGFDTAMTELLIPLTDFPDLSVEYQQFIQTTCDETAEVNLNVEGGLPPYTIQWEGDYSGFQFEISENQETEYNAIITDQCNLNTENVSILFVPEDYEPIQVIAPAEIEFNCLEPLSFDPLIAGGRGDYSITWEFNGSIISQESQISIPTPQEGLLNLLVEDGCVESQSVSIDLNLIDSPISVEIGDNFESFCNNEITIIPEIQGGIGGKAYKWIRNFVTESFEPIFTFTPFSSSIVIVEVTDQCSQKGYDTLTVFLPNNPLEINMPSDTSICKDEVFDYTPRVEGGYGELEYLWLETQSVSSGLNLTPTRDVIYTLQVIDECRKMTEASISLNIIDVEANFLFDYDNPDFPLINNSFAGLGYFWVLPGGETSTVFEPVFEPNVFDDQLVSLEVTHPSGCTDTRIDFYEPPLNVFIPTAFTPDGDGINDIFKAKGTFITDFEMWVYDRWGNTVFHSTDIDKGWDGSEADVSFAVQNLIYSYRVIAKGYNEQIFDKKGSVTVVR